MSRSLALAFIAFTAFTAAASACASVPADEVRFTGRVVDTDGRAVACRLYVRAAGAKAVADGWYFARSASDEGSAVEYRKQRGESVEMQTALSAHPFELDLPAGRYTFTIERGKEYVPLEETITIDGDASVERTFTLRRWIDLAARGWYSGETHVHRTLVELPTAMLADDLNVALPLTHWVTKGRVPPTRGDKNIAAGEKPELIRVDDTHVIWPLNTEYEIFTMNDRRHTLGAVFVLNHREPLSMGAPPVGPIARAAREQGALLDLDKHSWPWSLMLVPTMQVDLFELTNNHVWRTDFHFKRWTIETMPEFVELAEDEVGLTERGWIDYGLETYYALLGCGFDLRPSAGTASGVHPVPLGWGRVYVHLPDGFDYDAWMQGLAAGRTFVTTGPMLFVQTNAGPPGARIELEATGGTAHLTGNAESVRPLESIEVLVNGEVVERIAGDTDQSREAGYRTPIDLRVPIKGTSWVAVRCWERQPDGRVRFAHTAPVHFTVPGRPLPPNRPAVRWIVQRLQEEIARNRDVLEAGELAEFETALKRYEAMLE